MSKDVQMTGFLVLPAAMAATTATSRNMDVNNAGLPFSMELLCAEIMLDNVRSQGYTHSGGFGDRC